MTSPHLIIGLGTVVVDHQVILQKHPEVDEKTTILSDRYQVGGPVPTALAVLSGFQHKTHFIGAWGKDHFGEMIQNDFNQVGIQYLSEYTSTETQTGFAHVWIENSTGRRTISCKRPDKEFELTTQDREILKKATVLHLDGWPEQASQEAARIVKQNGGLVVLDTGSLKPATKPLLPLVDILNCPKHFPEQLFGEPDPLKAGQELLKNGHQIITITQGNNGAHLFTQDSHHFIPSIQVTAVDTTGAGDVFCGGLIHAILDKQSPEKAVQFASVTAALKCKKMGNREAIPSMDEIKKHL
jgi:sugar/nucleoside kinase (ribokinase family)